MKFVPAALSGGFVLLVAVLLVLWLGHSSEDKVSTVAPTPAAETRIILMGVRDRISDPFFLGGGNYRGVWSAWGETPVDPPCTHNVELVALDPSIASASIDLARLVHVPSTGVTAAIDLTNVEPGEYHLEIISACGWQIELSRHD